MNYVSTYNSPLGEIFLTATQNSLTGLRFEGTKYSKNGLSNETEKQETKIIKQAKNWLDIYFSGSCPEFMPPVNVDEFDVSAFQKSVLRILIEIPYGKTTSYSAIAREISSDRMSAQAIGGAVGRNPVLIIIPCHRVIASNGALTGYAAGIKRKACLLNLEGVKI